MLTLATNGDLRVGLGTRKLLLGVIGVFRRRLLAHPIQYAP